MKRKILQYSTLSFLLVFLVGCASLGIETKEKKFLIVQKEVNLALSQYKSQLEAQDTATQALWHSTYDKPIKAMSAALDAWQEVVMGLTGDIGQLQEFMRIKNELIILGWDYFSKKEVE